MALVERGGRVASYHVPNVTAATLKPIIAEALSTDSHFRTDESGVYWEIGEQFASHRTVVHSANEYVRGDAHTNTVEGYFSILKRGMYGVYQHVSEHHLKRYLGEFDFHYNERLALGVDDTERTICALRGIAGKRLHLSKASWSGTSDNALVGIELPATNFASAIPGWSFFSACGKKGGSGRPPIPPFRRAARPGLELTPPC
jgi:hypothetical protein